MKPHVPGSASPFYQSLLVALLCLNFGILFFDRMRSFESLTFLDEYSRYWVKD